jgi:hypothetical protein
MKDTKVIIALCTLLVAVFGLVWTIRRDSREPPKVVVTTGKVPAAEAELVAADGAQFSISPRTGYAYPPATYIGMLFIVRHVETRKELTRFMLKDGLNEVSF